MKDFDKRVAEALHAQSRSFGKSGNEITLISAYELPTHIPGDSGMIITYWRTVAHTDVGHYTETRFVIYPGETDKQTSYSGGILAQSWERE